MGNLCPIDKNPCNPECVLYRRGLRYRDDGGKPEPFEECALNVIADGVENMITRTIGVQKEMNIARNAAETTATILKAAVLFRSSGIDNPIEITENTERRNDG